MSAANTLKRTLSAVLSELPNKGVGLRVARDTWHPASGKFWEVAYVQPKKGQENTGLLNVWGYKYYKGERQNQVPKQIASVWKYNWSVMQIVGASATTSSAASEAKQ